MGTANQVLKIVDNLSSRGNVSPAELRKVNIWNLKVLKEVSAKISNIIDASEYLDESSGRKLSLFLIKVSELISNKILTLGNSDSVPEFLLSVARQATLLKNLDDLGEVGKCENPGCNYMYLSQPRGWQQKTCSNACRNSLFRLKHSV